MRSARNCFGAAFSAPAKINFDTPASRLVGRLDSCTRARPHAHILLGWVTGPGLHEQCQFLALERRRFSKIDCCTEAVGIAHKLRHCL